MTNKSDPEFQRSLHAARKQLDTSSKLGKFLDEYITKLVLEYGEYVPSTKEVRLSLWTPNLDGKNLARPLQIDSNKFLRSMNVDMDFYRANNLKANDLARKMDSNYSRAMNSLGSLISILSGKDSTWIWNIYGIAQNIVDFHNSIEEYKKHITQESFDISLNDAAKDIGTAPIMTKLNTDAQDLKQLVAEELKLMENPLDYLKDLATSAGEKAAAKYTRGGTQAKAQAKVQVRSRAADLFKGWQRTSAGADLEASKENLQAYLVGLGVPTPVVQKTMQDVSKLMQPTGPEKISKDLEKAQGDLGAQAMQTIQSSKDNYGTPIIEAESIIPDNQLRTFFMRVAQVENAFKVQQAALQQQKKEQEQAQQDIKQQSKDSEVIKKAIDQLPAKEKEQFIANLIKQYSSNVKK